MAEPIVQVTMNDYLDDLCTRPNLTRAELRQLRRSAQFGDILAHSLEHCPELAALLSDQATATIPKNSRIRDDNGVRNSGGGAGTGGSGGGTGGSGGGTG
ncbi:MAG: hypothetical protein WBB85_07260, partial [Albidovulum sp.]